jgi:hypothetical protein
MCAYGAHIVCELGDAEVEDLDPLASSHVGIAHEEHVVWLQISMHDANAMGSAERAGYLLQKPYGHGRVEPSYAFQACRQRLAM